LTGQLAAREPPPNPYASGPRPAVSATVAGPGGLYTVRAGAPVHVGRDPARCPIVLGEPRISGVHATLEFRDGQLWVRDEGSNNGTHVGGVRVPAGAWMPAPPGVALRFGPVEFTVRHETA